MNMKKLVGIMGVAFLGSVIGIAAFTLVVKPEVKYVQEAQVPSAVLTSLPSPNMEMADFRLAAQSSVDAVVHVTSTKFYEQNEYRNMREFFFDDPSGKKKVPKSGFGSGVIVSPDGYLVTNNHVIKDADEISVKLNDGRILEAEVVGTDPNSDVAVLKVKEKNLPYLVFGDSNELQLGDWVLAVGNPLSLQTTVTAGIVSALARDIDIIGTEYRRNRYGQVQRVSNPLAVESFIQTDAAVNQGNSGGALVNLRGELVGINTAIASQTGGYTGYSFAIPASIAKKVMNDIIEYGTVKRSALGIRISDVTEKVMKTENLSVSKGALVTDVVEDGGALKAGIKAGDVIVGINGSSINSGSQLRDNLFLFGPEDRIEVIINRKGKEKAFMVELSELNLGAPLAGDSQFWNWLGAELEALDAEDLERMDIPYGVRVKELKNGVLKENELPEGFVITDINKQKVDEVEDVKRIINSIEKGGVFIEGILPNGKYDYFTFRK